MVEKTLESSLGYRAILRLGKWDKDLSFFIQAGRAVKLRQNLFIFKGREVISLGEGSLSCHQCGKKKMIR